MFIKILPHCVLVLHCCVWNINSVDCFRVLSVADRWIWRSNWIVDLSWTDGRQRWVWNGRRSTVFVSSGLRHLETTVLLSVENASSLCWHKNSSLQGYIPDQQFCFQLYSYTDCTLHIWLYGVQITLKTHERSSSLRVKKSCLTSLLEFLQTWKIDC